MPGQRCTVKRHPLITGRQVRLYLPGRSALRQPRRKQNRSQTTGRRDCSDSRSENNHRRHDRQQSHNKPRPEAADLDHQHRKQPDCRQQQGNPQHLFQADHPETGARQNSSQTGQQGHSQIRRGKSQPDQQENQ